MTAATDFAESLLGAARVPRLESSPLVAGIMAGTLSRDVVRSYAVTIASAAAGFPRSIAAVLSLCDEVEVRRLLLSNLLEEEGAVAYVPGEGVAIEPSRRHLAMARKFAHAAGAEGDVGVRSTSAWFSESISRGDWIGAFAFFSVGFEANVPQTFRLIVGPLEQHYGFTRADLEFLIEHCDADERHGVESAQLIARIARSQEARQAAMAGAKRGGLAWGALHRAVAARRLG